MRQLIITVILSLIMINCKGQQNDTIKQNNVKKDTMEYFNENKYKDWELYRKNSTMTEKYYKKGDTLARVIFYKGEYTEEIEQINSPYKEYKYYHNNNLLKSSIKEFYTFQIGITKEYDENGKLIKETDWDKNYPFKVEDLYNLIKEEYNVDLMTISHPKNNDDIQYSVERNYLEESKKHCYVVIFQYSPPDEGYNSRLKKVYVDGETGKIMYEDGWTWGGLPKSKTPVPIKGEKEKKTSSIYKTYEGKDYTQAEWEAYEEKQYEEYCKKTGRNYVPKNQQTNPSEQDPRKSFLANNEEQVDKNTPKKKKGFLGGLFC